MEFHLNLVRSAEMLCEGIFFFLLRAKKEGQCFVFAQRDLSHSGTPL